MVALKIMVKNVAAIVGAHASIVAFYKEIINGLTQF
jgi:hypothetical protein